MCPLVCSEYLIEHLSACLHALICVCMCVCESVQVYFTWSLDVALIRRWGTGLDGQVGVCYRATEAPNQVLVAVPQVGTRREFGIGHMARQV